MSATNMHIIVELYILYLFLCFDLKSLWVAVTSVFKHEMERTIYFCEQDMYNWFATRNFKACMCVFVDRYR